MPDERSQSIFDAFCDLTLPKSEWTHHAHLVVCRVALSTRSASETIDFLRQRISAYNETTGVANTSSSGYHETLTRYFVGAVASLGEAEMAAVFEAPRGERSAPLRYWSRELLFSPAARADWVEPDLAVLPWSADGLLRQTSQRADHYGRRMDFAMPESTQQLLDDLDAFIESTIRPMEEEDDNVRFFDHRREDSRTDWDRDGLPNAEWEALLRRMRVAADEAGFYRHQLPERFGGKNGSNLEMAIVREHLARKGLGLHNDLQNESSIVGNLVTVLMMEKYGSPAQQAEWIPKMLDGTARIGFGLTEPLHGSDATWMETRAVRDGDEWVITGEKYWNTGLHHATHDYIFARTSGEPGDGRGVTCFITPTDAPGFEIEEFMWTFNMPTDHAHVRLNEVRVGNDDILGEEGLGLQTAQLFVHENRIRQAASSLGAGLHCIDLAVDYANQRTTFGKRLSTNQAIQFPLADLAAEAEMLHALIQKTAWQLDAGVDHMEITDKVAMCNYRANRFCCNAADQAMQTCGGQGYNRAMPFEHIYRHHRRYRITEGSDEIQIRKVAGKLFGYTGRAKG